MTHGSLFAGIGGFDLGFERAGIRTVWMVENNGFCQKILTRHFPDAKLYGDCCEVDPSELEKVDIISAGFPCQDLSVAGRRAGLKGERSGLFFEVERFAQALRPAWLVLENVPGLLSSNEGRDFAVVLSTLAELGYGVSWRILDSQFFGVPQRRRRVFIVGCLGRPCPPEILFEPEGRKGDTPQSRKAGEDTPTNVTKCLASGGKVTGTLESVYADKWGLEDQHATRCDASDNLIIPIDGRGGKVRTDQSDDSTGAGGTGIGNEGDPSFALGGAVHAVAHNATPWDVQRTRIADMRGTSPTVKAGEGRQGREDIFVGQEINPNGMREASGVPRRVDTPDSPRYRALGNAVTVNVAEWIGRRLVNYCESNPD